jgi:hypothetical protein
MEIRRRRARNQLKNREAGDGNRGRFCAEKVDRDIGSVSS